MKGRGVEILKQNPFGRLLGKEMASREPDKGLVNEIHLSPSLQSIFLFSCFVFIPYYFLMRPDLASSQKKLFDKPQQQTLLAVIPLPLLPESFLVLFKNKPNNLRNLHYRLILITFGYYQMLGVNYNFIEFERRFSRNVL